MKLNWQSFKNVVFGDTAFDRRFRKKVFGVEEFQKLPLRGRIAKAVITCTFLIFFAVWMYSLGFFVGTGTLPFAPSSQSVVPPDISPTVTAQEAEELVENGAIDVPDYGEKNNCVEMAFLAARQLWWEGYQGTVIRIDFSDGSGHMIVGIPTSDEGWKFYDPTGDAWVYPRVGGYFMTKTVTGLYYLYDFVWEPIEVMDK